MRITRNYRRLPVITVILVLFAACQKQVAVPRPGAVDQFDSDTYDALLIAKAATEQAKSSFAAGKLPAGAKTVINHAIEAYNVAEAAWQAYHAARGAEGSGSLPEKMANVTAALAQLFRAYPAAVPNTAAPIQ